MMQNRWHSAREIADHTRIKLDSSERQALGHKPRRLCETNQLEVEGC